MFVRPFRVTPEAVSEAQPVESEHALLVYSGRVDNRAEIARRCGKPALATAGDGDVLVAAYREWGAEFPREVIGEYSFAVIDHGAHRLVAGRDSLGGGRLFYYKDADALWVASNLELMLDAVPRIPQFSRDALAEYFASGGLPTSGRTIYAGITEVPAAHILTHVADRVTVSRYWYPVAGVLTLRRDEEYDELFRSLLSDGVRAALRANGPVLCDLSGGLDSSTVTAVALTLDGGELARRTGLVAFSSFASQTDVSNEREYQLEFERMYAIRGRTLDIDQHVSFEGSEPQSCHPSKAIVYRPVWAATDALRAECGATAHLTGRGGDNIFCGDGFPPLYLSDLLREFRVGTWAREVRAWASTDGRRSLWNLVWHCSRRTPTDLFAGLEQRGTPPGWLVPKFLSDVTAAEHAPWSSGPRIFDSAARELQYRSIAQTAATLRIIRTGDERQPLLHRPLVEFMLTLPWRHLLSARDNRIIQRRALRGLLPEGIRARVSKHSGTPVLLRGLREHWHALHDITRGRRLADHGLVDAYAFQSACERMRHGLIGKHLRYLVAALTIEIWLAANDSWLHGGGARPMQAYFSGGDPTRAA
jgi:asparagine synthase (glutamine-hydrolysing)